MDEPQPPPELLVGGPHADVELLLLVPPVSSRDADAAPHPDAASLLPVPQPPVADTAPHPDDESLSTVPQPPLAGPASQPVDAPSVARVELAPPMSQLVELDVDRLLPDPHPIFPESAVAFGLCCFVVDCPEKFQAEDASISLAEDFRTPPGLEAGFPHLLTPSGREVVFEAVVSANRRGPAGGPPRRPSWDPFF
jgi:hypothetical protein